MPADSNKDDDDFGLGPTYVFQCILCVLGLALSVAHFASDTTSVVPWIILATMVLTYTVKCRPQIPSFVAVMFASTLSLVFAILGAIAMIYLLSATPIHLILAPIALIRAVFVPISFLIFLLARVCGMHYVSWDTVSTAMEFFYLVLLFTLLSPIYSSSVYTWIRTVWESWHSTPAPPVKPTTTGSSESRPRCIEHTPQDGLEEEQQNHVENGADTHTRTKRIPPPPTTMELRSHSRHLKRVVRNRWTRSDIEFTTTHTRSGSP